MRRRGTCHPRKVLDHGYAVLCREFEQPNQTLQLAVVSTTLDEKAGYLEVERFIKWFDDLVNSRVLKFRLFQNSLDEFILR
jgi:hypothetical protein